MRGTVWAMVVAKLAEVAAVLGPLQGIPGEPFGLAINAGLVQQLEERIEGRTQMKTATASVTDIRHPQPLRLEGMPVPGVFLRHPFSSPCIRTRAGQICPLEFFFIITRTIRQKTPAL